MVQAEHRSQRMFMELVRVLGVRVREACDSALDLP